MNTKTKILNLFRSIFKISFLEKWLQKSTQGKPTNSFFCKLVPNNYQYKNGSLRKFNYKGANLQTDVHDYVGHYLYFGFQDIGQEKLIDLAKQGNTILDIGTNIGSTLLQFAKKVEENGKVYGFEPDNINFQACRNNISLNQFKNIEIENIGLGNENGQFDLSVDTETNRGGNRIKLNGDKSKTATQITVKRLDDWILQKEIFQIDLIKIDVEGFELKVLQGAVQTIKKFNPTLFIEIDDNNLKAVNDSAKNLILFLKELGYEKMINAENNQVVRPSDDFTGCHFDVIAEI